jgi:hypothetical protein
MPPFSNWEPSFVPVLRRLGLRYALLSCAALPMEARNRCGFWSAGHAGDFIALFPTHILHHFSAPADITDWMEKLISRDESGQGGEKLIAVHYLLPLQPQGGIDPCRWLSYAVEEIDKRILLCRSVLLQEAASLQPPLGLQHLPACLPLHEPPDGQAPHYFLNRLHSFDQIGIIQRKLLEIYDRAAAVKDGRLAGRIRHLLYFLQDINRFLPLKNSGFTVLSDRQWMYSQLIGIERTLREHEGTSGGKIEITDFLRNGNKSITMSNNALKVCIDYKYGGRIFELDFCDRAINLCAALNPAQHALPDILSPGKTWAAFIDRILPEQTAPADFTGGTTKDQGTFAGGAFEYKIKKTGSSVKTVLSRQGSFQRDDKTIPLGIEKVFGLEKDAPSLSFVYQLSNNSLAPFSLTFAVELYLSLPGAAGHDAHLVAGKTVYPNIGWESVILQKTTRWNLNDLASGVRLQFFTQKPVDVHCLPVPGSELGSDPSCGIRLILAVPVTLAQSSTWSLIGNIRCRKIREKQKGASDAI